jgi:ectoine hydroxylase-related dioxygenase (phytanoyl-CoA dioxygenase family)
VPGTSRTLDDVTITAPPSWFVDADYDVDAFRELVGRLTHPSDVPTAIDIVGNIPIYDGPAMHAIARDPQRRRALLGELAWALGHGPGAVAFRQALTDDENRLADATDVFQSIIADQHAAGRAIGDHFAKPGSNDRVWNSHEKLAQRAPDVFVAYYSSDVIALGCEAWLGPHYQISAQVNRVNPGGTAQVPHRDYHVGFYTAEEMARFPRHVHLMSQALTLQGAVAHTDMPLESGPTMLLPFSQLSPAGFIASYRDDFRVVFHEHMVQLPLERGDMVFFNPAVFHGAGANHTADFERMANLLQVSSAFGRTMETMSPDVTTLAAYPFLAGLTDERTRENVIAAACAGYAFPTNLDSDPPTGGLAPPSQADMIRGAVAQRWPLDRVRAELAARNERRQGVT